MELTDILELLPRRYRSVMVGILIVEVVTTQDYEIAIQNALAIGTNLPQHLRSALNQIEEPYRTLVLLRDVEGTSYKDLCRELNMPLNTVKVYLYRGRRRLRTFLE